MRMAMTVKDKRFQYILKKLSAIGFVDIKVLSEELNVSEMTIRRDLAELSQNNLIKLIHGGAILQRDDLFEKEQDRYLIEKAGSLKMQEKIKICQKAASLINRDDIIVIDTGTTTEYIPNYIPKNIPITVVCYALNILFKVYENEKWKLIFPGGHFHRNTLMFESNEGNKMTQRMRANKAFISAAGVSDKLGVTCATLYEKETKKAVIQSSAEKILLVDSSKFGKIEISYFANLSDFDIIITDRGISKECIEKIKELNIQLYIV
jgi:DeoR family transcriptional regulator, deoxyribose operon repressor